MSGALINGIAPEKFLRRLFQRAVDHADPMRCVPPALPERPEGRVVVIGAGKASARMAQAVEQIWGPCEGLIITRYGHGRKTRSIEVVEAGHPVSDAAGYTATQRMLTLLGGLTRRDFVLALISGGGSALLCKPAPGLTIRDLQPIDEQLIESGATIAQINRVRKHLSGVKGGQLATACRAPMLALAISDVPGDDPADIASGPTVGDASTGADALRELEALGIRPRPPLLAHLKGETGVIPPGDPRLAHVRTDLIATPAGALEAAAQEARAHGITVEILGDALEGESRDLGAAHARLALERRKDGPLLLLSGGETTVTQHGMGIGGPNAEYMLAAAQTLAGADNIWGIACDTDGIDGVGQVAGALITPDILTRTDTTPADALARNDAHSWFAEAGTQIITGPTYTNVNDFRALLIL